ncbi:MAG: hypothetical protein IPL91_07170 [Hyphomicrobium sp.]|jgi:hypothetical protein|nr:hypothetical protein [Hyphomicrobium sp.]
MKNLATWLGSLLSMVLAAFLGAYLNSIIQTDIWRKDKLYSMRLEIFEKRNELFRLLSENLAESAKFAFQLNGATPETDKFSRMVFCVEPSKRAENATFCKDFSATADEQERFREFALKRAQFQTMAMMANIYFCRNTKAAIASLPSGGYWWNLDEAKKAALLSAMQSEMFCAIQFSDLELR